MCYNSSEFDSRYQSSRLVRPLRRTSTEETAGVGTFQLLITVSSTSLNIGKSGGGPVTPPLGSSVRPMTNHETSDLIAAADEIDDIAATWHSADSLPADVTWSESLTCPSYWAMRSASG